jgi:diacylglycerol kinase (ATP)
VAEILIVGGDGTINEAVRGIIDPQGPRTAHRPTLSILPLGTGSDLARGLGLFSVDDAMAALCDARIAQLDVGMLRDAAPDAENLCFVNVADVGLGACVAERVNRNTKALGGLPSYLLGALRELAHLRVGWMEVFVDEQQIHAGPLAMALIANGRYYGGGMQPAPQASMTDGLFDVVLLRDLPRLTMATQLLPKVYSGAHIHHRGVIVARGSTVAVQCEHEQPVSQDGEVTRMTAFTATVVPSSLRVRAGRAASSVNKVQPS